MIAIQTVEAHGIPVTEYRHEPETDQLITIEFRPNHQKYDYPQPEFVFQETVAMLEQYNECCSKHLYLSENLDYFTVSALELVEHRVNGKLQSEPTWLYGIRYARGTRELLWFESDELISIRDIKQPMEF
ncbi:hypothetical protein [Merismopedia glauca]|uniref:Uncharacterized protein n=1 Tax=Merismopedia glauca CCAP 1448/3 TaxID=1296344 RepID=A0A2T1BXA9_9CYAN|nr:hypothetical protein [Merismopedia glauca]PSB00547.1 hypothetical protein C7B64_22965 [Merismopedia glauca CCAP 1448/3]